MANCVLFDAKYHFQNMLKMYLEPMLELNKYDKKKNNYWTKINNEIKIEIKLQKSTSNTKAGVLFCFVISLMMENSEKYGYSNRQDFYLTAERLAYKENNHQANWYLIFRNTDEYEKMLQILTTDFEEYIIPVLDEIKTNSLLEKIIHREKMEKGNIWYINEMINFK